MKKEKKGKNMNRRIYISKMEEKKKKRIDLIHNVKCIRLDVLYLIHKIRFDT